MLSKRVKFLGLLIFIAGIAITMTACDMGDGPADEIREDTYTVSVQVEEEVEFKTGKPLAFEGGVMIDPGTQDIFEGSKVTKVTELEKTLPSHLKPAGKIINFEFSNIEFSEKITIRIPAEENIDIENSGLYYYDEDKEEWIKQEAEFEYGAFVATVSNFSTYAVLEEEKIEKKIDVPYIHQIDDTSISNTWTDEFNGQFACGATSAVMIAAYFDKKYDILGGDFSDKYGKYVSRKYTNKFDYSFKFVTDLSEPYPGRNTYKNIVGAGAFGYIHRDDDGPGNWTKDAFATRPRIKDYFDAHNIEPVYSEIVEFEDSNLEADIREIINKPEGDIYLEDVINIKALETDGRGDRIVESFEGIQSLKNLEKLYFLGYGIDDLTPIAELTNLKTLGFGSWEPTFIDDISPFGNLSNLENLYISANRASDISVIGNLVNLKELVLWRSVVDGDISFLASLENLEYLYLHRNGIEDISVLANLKNLKDLDIGDNNVKDISPIKNLNNLKTLKIGGSGEGIPSGGNKFDDLTPIENLTNLEVLTLHFSNVSDISILENFTYLKELNFSYTEVSDISPLESLTNLESLIFDSTEVSDISSLANLTNLEELWFWDNEVSDISPLVENDGFGAGDTINMRENHLSLTEGSEDMNNIQELIDRGVNVWYEPQK